MAQDVQADLGLGKIELTYSLNSLRRISELFLSLKKLPSCRDLNLFFTMPVPSDKPSLLSLKSTDQILREIADVSADLTSQGRDSQLDKTNTGSSYFSMSKKKPNL